MSSTMSSTMTPLEAAEKMETAGELIWKNDEVGIFKITKDDAKAFQTALFYLRKIVAGEYKPVVHAHWEWVEISPIKKELHCSNCGFHGFRTPHCPSCGALMDGKDDSHETD